MADRKDDKLESTEEFEDSKLAYEGSSQDEDVDLYDELTVNEIGKIASPRVIRELLLTPSKTNRVKTGSTLDDDVDLYEDLNTFQNHIEAEELQEKVNSLTDKYSALDKENAELKKELERVKKQNHAFKVNISSIYKTAKLELGRKDRQLQDLQQQHDSLLFRRGNNSKKPPTNNETEKNKERTDTGKVIQIENNTECEFRMGNNSVSIVVESHPFQEARFRRFEHLAAAIVRNERLAKNGNQTHSKESQSNGEEGEIIDDRVSSRNSSRNSSSRPDSCSKEPLMQPKETIRSSHHRNKNEHHRSRSPIGKRKRSPSIERRYLRSRSPVRENNDRPSTLRNARSPQKKSARYKPDPRSIARRPRR